MSSSQTPVIPRDDNGQPIPFIIPSEHGDILAMPLAIPAASRVLLNQATGFPAESLALVRQAPAITGWFFVNTTAERLWIAGSEVTTGLGVPVEAGDTTPQLLGLMTDLAKTYVFNPGVAAVSAVLVVMGRLD